MADPEKVIEIIEAVSIPVMGKVRIGHFVEAQVLEVLGVDMIDESEVLTPADEQYHIDKKQFKVPFVCGARDLGEALRRINEGAAMIRTKGEAGTGNVVEAVRHMRNIMGEIRMLRGLDKQEMTDYAREIEAPAELVFECAERGRLPVVNFSAGGIATPSDAALMMQLGADGVFVGSGIFKSSNPETDGKSDRRSGQPLRRCQRDRKGQQGTWRCDAGPRCPHAQGRRGAPDPWTLRSACSRSRET